MKHSSIEVNQVSSLPAYSSGIISLISHKCSHTSSAHRQPEKHPPWRPSEGPYIRGSIHWNAIHTSELRCRNAIHTLEVHTSKRYLYIGGWSIHRSFDVWTHSSNVWTCLYAPLICWILEIIKKTCEKSKYPSRIFGRFSYVIVYSHVWMQIIVF